MKIMIERFKAYLNKDFASLPRTIEVDDLYEELLGNLLERAEAEKAKGEMTDDEIFNYCISSLGDYKETLKAMDVRARFRFSDLIKNIVIWTGLWFFATILVYLATSFITIGWSWSWLIIVIATAIYIVALDIYGISVAIKNSFFHVFRVLCISLGVLLDLCFFFLFAGITTAWNVAWLVTVLIPFIICSVDLCVTLLLFKKFYFIELLLSILFFSVAVFLIIAQLWIGYEFAWIIVLGGLFIDALLLVGRQTFIRKKR